MRAAEHGGFTCGVIAAILQPLQGLHQDAQDLLTAFGGQVVQVCKNTYKNIKEKIMSR